MDTMIRRRFNIACLQETRGVEKKYREIENRGYRLWFIGKGQHRNWVGIS